MKFPKLPDPADIEAMVADFKTELSAIRGLLERLLEIEEQRLAEEDTPF